MVQHGKQCNGAIAEGIHQRVIGCGGSDDGCQAGVAGAFIGGGASTKCRISNVMCQLVNIELVIWN